MPEYLLPCTCGEQNIVSTAQAGETIHCVCGASLQVPTLRGLHELEPLDRSASPARSAVTWEDHHRVAFLFLVGALSCVGVAIYLWASLPARAVQPTTEQFGEALDEATATQLMFIHNEAVRGMLGNPNSTEVERKTRQMMQWGIGIVLVLAIAALVAAMLVLASRPKRVANTHP